MPYDHYPKTSRTYRGAVNVDAASPLQVTGYGSNAATAATRYLSPGWVNHATAQVPLFVVPEGYTNIHSLQVVTTTAPGGTDTYIVTIQRSTDDGANYTDTTLTCTVTGSDLDSYDNTNVPTVAEGDILAIKAVSSGATAAAALATFCVS
jgi:hypothetical protein